MVCRLIEGWESSTTPADYTGKWTSLGSGVTISAAGGRSGNGLRGSTLAHNVARTFDSQPTWVVGFAFRLTAVPPSATIAILTLQDGAGVHCGIAVQQSTGLLVAFRATAATVLGTSAVAVSANTWGYVEGRFTIGDAGSAVVRLNGVPVIDLPTADTRNGGTTATANLVRLGPTTNPGATYDFDDVYVFDGTGSVNNDFAGECKVVQLLPTGAGPTTAWTPSAGANWQCVDEAPPTGDTDYVASSTAGQTDTYAFGDLAVVGAVKAVQATAQARKDDAGSRSLALVARPGSTDRVGATLAVGDAYSTLPQVWDTNPDTAAAWTVADVNAGAFGLRLIA